MRFVNLKISHKIASAWKRGSEEDADKWDRLGSPYRVTLFGSANFLLSDVKRLLSYSKKASWCLPATRAQRWAIKPFGQTTLSNEIE